MLSINEIIHIWTDLALSVWLRSSVGRASHRYRGSHRFESRWSPDLFRLLPSNGLNWKINCDDHSSYLFQTMNSYWMRLLWYPEWSRSYRDLDYSGYQKTKSNNCFIMYWMNKPGSLVFASSLTASNTKRANFTRWSLDLMHRGHTWHDYTWP